MKRAPVEISAPKFIYYGHHKCASMWICNILQQACTDIGLRFDQAARSKLEYLGQTHAQFVQQNKLDFFGYTTADPEGAREFCFARGFHVIRDPRDICVSAYFSHRYSHPVQGHTAGMAVIRAELEQLDQDEGLLKTIQNSQQQFEEMVAWDYAQANVLEIKMETMIQNPYQGFLDIFAFLSLLGEQRPILVSRKSGVLRVLVAKAKHRLLAPKNKHKISPERLLGIVYANRFSEKSRGRLPGEEDSASHYRKGITGDWINYFKPIHREYFKRHYADVLVKLGYEQDDNW
jgi:hypothetical protein